MYHLDLFSGIGGFALACQWAGIETIGFVEIDKYCQGVLRKHWPNVPIVEDIRDVEKIKEIIANNNCWRRNGNESSQETPRLNPQFVEWLMGFPILWTDCESSETRSSLWLRLMRSEFSRLVSRIDPDE